MTTNLKAEKMPRSTPKGNRETLGQLPLDKITDTKIRQRKLVFTSFDETEPKNNFDNEEINNNQVKYLIYGKETCPTTNKNHFQGFVYFYEKTSIKNAKMYLQIKNGWFQYAFGTIDQNIKYCSKEGNFKEFGDKPQQGKRKDLDELRDDLLNNKTTVDDIAKERPHMYHMYGRTLNKLEDLTMRRQYRSEMTEGIWIYGPTGVGKSHEAFKNYSPDTHYVLINDSGWWDAYKQQDTVIINDFRGWIKYDELLQLLDKFPHFVKRRNREPLPFTSKKVIITSPLTPEEVYKNRNEKDELDQLIRRLKIIHLKKDDGFTLQ